MQDLSADELSKIFLKYEERMKGHVVTFFTAWGQIGYISTLFSFIEIPESFAKELSFFRPIIARLSDEDPERISIERCFQLFLLFWIDETEYRVPGRVKHRMLANIYGDWAKEVPLENWEALFADSRKPTH